MVSGEEGILRPRPTESSGRALRGQATDRNVPYLLVHCKTFLPKTLSGFLRYDSSANAYRFNHFQP